MLKGIPKHIVDYLFGYDFFISYCWKDGRDYAVDLHNKLTSIGYSCFLDSSDYARGDNWRNQGKHALKKTSCLVLVGTPAALSSEPVINELNIFSSYNRRIIPIDIDACLSMLRDDQGISLFLDSEVLKINEPKTALSLGVSECTINEIVRSFNFTRQEKKRLRWVSVLAAVFFIVSAIAAVFATLEQIARQTAELERDRALLSHSGFLMERARKENDNGHHDVAMLLGLNAMPGVYGGLRPIPSEVGPLITSIMKNQKRAIFQHEHPVTQAIFSPDGKWLATSAEHYISLWDIETRNKHYIFHHNSGINHIFFSSDGQLLISATKDNTVTAWDTKTGNKVKTLHSPYPWVEFEKVAISKDNNWVLASYRGRGQQLLWNFKTGEYANTFQGHQLVSLIPDSQRLITISSGELILWDIKNEEKIRSYQYQNDTRIINSAVSPNGQQLALFLFDKVQVWDVNTGNTTLIQLDEKSSYGNISFSHDSHLLAIYLNDSIMLWNPDTDVKKHFKFNHNVTHVDFSSDNERLLISTEGRTAIILEIKSGETLNVFPHGHEVKFSSFGSDDQILLTLSSNTVALWDAQPMETLQTFNFNDDIRYTAFSPNGRMLLALTEDNKAIIWDTETWEQRQSFEFDSYIIHIEFSSNNDWIITSSSQPMDNNTAYTTGDIEYTLWDIQTKNILQVFHQDNSRNDVSAFSSFNLTGNKVATSSLEKIILWDTETGEKLLTVEYNDMGGVYGMTPTFSRDGKMLLSRKYRVNSSPIIVANLWDTNSGEIIHTLRHSSHVEHAAFNPSGKRVVTASWDETASIWDAKTGKKVHTLVHNGRVEYATYSLDGQWIVTASSDQSAILWNAISGEKLKTFQHENPVYYAEITPDNRLVLTMFQSSAQRKSIDQRDKWTIAIWDVKTGEKIQSYKHYRDNRYINVKIVHPNNQWFLSSPRKNAAVIRRLPLSRDDLVYLAERNLPVNRYCLTPEERQKHFLSKLTDEQYEKRGCSQFAFINKTNNSDSTPLISSIYNNEINTIKSLINAGANINLTSSRGWTPLMVAVNQGRTEIVRLLLSEGADQLTPSTKHGGWSVLHMTANLSNKGGDILQAKIAEILIQSGSRVNAETKGGDTTLSLAVRNNRPHVIDVLLKYGANINHQDQIGTPLKTAVYNGNLNIVKKLLRAGADVNLPYLRSSALHTIVEESKGGDELQAKIAKALVEAGASLHSLNHDGEMALLLAVQNNKPAVMEVLLSAGANVDVGGTDVYVNANPTPLIAAINTKNTPIAKRLIEVGANVNLPSSGWSYRYPATPLIHSINVGRKEIVQLLIESGANVDLDSDGMAPLMLAVRKGHVAIVDLLLKAGANIGIVNKEMKSVEDIAQELEDSETSTAILQLLKK